jgi:hypothetical protein
MCACRGRRHAAAGLGFKFPGRSESGRRSPPGSRRRVRLGARPALGGPARPGPSPRVPLVTLRQVAPQLELGPLVPASGHRRAALFREPKTPNRSPRRAPSPRLGADLSLGAGLRRGASPLVYAAPISESPTTIILGLSALTQRANYRDCKSAGLAARAESRPACSMLRCNFKAQLPQCIGPAPSSGLASADEPGVLCRFGLTRSLKILAKKSHSCAMG